MADVKILGMKELREAIKRNPEKILRETRDFLQRGMALYKRGIINEPWRIGGAGGGSPVSNDSRYYRAYQRQRSGNLRDSHQTTIDRLQASIGPDMQRAPYAGYVHEGTFRMQSRPWLDYVKQNQDSGIRELYNNLLRNIVRDLAK
jgi:hypothetical protein